MIYESGGYKEELGKIYARMFDRQRQKRWAERSYFLTEKDFFVGFFLIRKLIEGKTKLTREIATQNVELIKFRSTGKVANNYNRHDIDELYDLENGHKVTKKVDFVCSLAVHSFIFMPVISAEGLHAFLINSFNVKDSELYQIEVKEVIRLFKSVGNCHIAYAVMKRTADGGFEMVLSETKNKAVEDF